MMRDKKDRLTIEMIGKYVDWLKNQERSENTVGKYRRDLMVLYRWLGGRPLTKETLIEWKRYLVDSRAAASVNSMLAAVNGFLQFMGLQEMAVKPLKIQKPLFCNGDRELTKKEYVRLVETAIRAGKERLSLILQTICATGIRVSELAFITVEAVRTGRTQISNKGKLRTVFLPKKLCQLLEKYLRKEKRTEGAVFVSRMGRALDRSNIWREMKKLCESANVNPEKVFPHNLRHLFARIYYSMERDLSRLADILGHSNIDTTRLYTMESGETHARQIGRMGLVVT